MARDSLGRTALGIAGVVAALVVVVFITWWNQPKPAVRAETAAPGVRSAPGWEIRYNATLALAQRGSSKLRLGLLEEMLDEDQLRRNIRTKLNDGREVPNEGAVQETVIAALKAVAELHRKNPALSLTELNEPLEKLEQSPNLVVRTEAKKTRQALTTN